MRKPETSRGMRDAGMLPDLFQAPAQTPDSPIGAEGHRHRMRQRLLTVGPDALADHEMLEMILFTALPRRDTKPIARDLLKRFRGFAGTVGAPAQELRSIDGLGEAGVAAIKLVQAAALRMMRREIEPYSVLDNWESLMTYLKVGMEYERTEQFRVLYLNRQNCLLADEVMGHGTVDQTPAYPREIVKRCLQHNATALILTHNHPSGEPTPSREDIATTEAIADAVRTIGVTIHDHVIIGRSRWLSFRREQLLS